MYTPSSLEEIQDIIQKARENGKTVRALGSGHSWNEMGVSNDIYISLHNYRGIVSTKIEEKWGMPDEVILILVFDTLLIKLMLVV